LIEEYLLEPTPERERNCKGVFKSYDEVLAKQLETRGISMEEYE
jgi:hypothetical protein